MLDRGGICASALLKPFPDPGTIDGAPAITDDCRFGASDGPAVASAWLWPLACRLKTSLYAHSIQGFERRILNIVTIHMRLQRNLPSRETFMADIAFIWAFLGVCFAC